MCKAPLWDACTQLKLKVPKGVNLEHLCNELAKYWCVYAHNSQSTLFSSKTSGFSLPCLHLTNVPENHPSLLLMPQTPMICSSLSLCLHLMHLQPPINICPSLSRQLL